jgi:hypothetical protein
MQLRILLVYFGLLWLLAATRVERHVLIGGARLLLDLNYRLFFGVRLIHVDCGLLGLLGLLGSGQGRLRVISLLGVACIERLRRFALQGDPNSGALYLFLLLSFLVYYLLANMNAGFV